MSGKKRKKTKLYALPFPSAYGKNLYIAYNKKTNRIIAYADNESDVIKYLLANDMREECDIKVSDNAEFNSIFICHYNAFRLDYYFKNRDLICTDYECGLYIDSFREYFQKVRETINNLKMVYNSMDLTEKEKNAIFKATKIIYDKNNSVDYIKDKTLNNKDLRKLLELEIALNGFDGTLDIKDVFGYYMIMI